MRPVMATMFMWAQIAKQQIQKVNELTFVVTGNVCDAFLKHLSVK